MKHWRLWLYVIPVRTVAAVCVLALNLVHPIIHGTPLDSGALDALLQHIDMFAMGVAHDHQGGTSK